MELRAELHAAQTPATTPLAATAAVNMTSGSTGPWELDFSGAQMNQTVLPDSAEDFWLVIYATDADDNLFTLGKIALTLTFDNVSQVTPAPPDPALFLDLGGTRWKTAESYLIDDVVALSGSIYVCTANNTSSATSQPGTGATWTSFWTLFSGGGGGGTVTAVSVTTANGVSGTSSGGATPALTLTLGAITPTSVNGIALTNGGSGALTVTGTASIAGASSGTNTGDQTITLTGDVTGSGAGSFAATIASSAVTYAKMQAVSAASRLLGRGTAGTTAVREISLGTGLSMSGDVLSATATGGGANTIMRLFPKDNEPPASGFATLDTRNSHPILDFPSTGSPTAIFRTYVPQGATFAGSGTALTIYIDAAATSATSGVVGWSVSLERLVAGGQDLDSDNFGTAQSSSQTISGTSGVMCRTTVIFTQAQLPSSLAAGDMFRIRIQRNTSVGSNHTGDAEFVGAYLEITPSGA
jgi:hypothetical protein